MEPTAQLRELIRLHGQDLATLWLGRVATELGSRDERERAELHEAAKLWLSWLADALSTESGRAAPTEPPALHPCLTLLGYDVLLDALCRAADDLFAEPNTAVFRDAANELARAVCQRGVAHSTPLERAAYAALQARFAQLALERAELQRGSVLAAAAFEELPMGAGVADVSGQLLVANRELRAMLARATATPKHGAGNGASDDAGALDERPLAHALNQRQVLHHDSFELNVADGDRIPVSVTAVPMVVRNRPATVVLTGADDGRRQLRDLERFWALARDLLCVIGTDAYFRRVNPAFTRVLGYSEEELLATSLLEFVHPEDRAATVLELRKATQGVPTVRFENRYRCRDGVYKWLSWSATPVSEEAATYAIARDVSDEHKVGDAQALLSRFGTLVASCLDYDSTVANLARVVVPALADWAVVDLVSPDGKLQRAEVACSDSTRSSLAARLRNATPRRPEHPALRALKSGRLSSISEVTPERLRAIATDARDLDTLTTVGPRSVVSVPLQIRGQALGVITLIMAESGRRYGPEELMLLQDLSRRAAQALDNARLLSQAREHVAFEQRVVAVVSHDLRNPLTAIAMVVTRMLHEQLETKQQQQLVLIQRSVQRALALVSDLLDVARARVSGGIPLAPTDADLEQVVLDVVEEARASHPNRTIDVQVEGDVRGTWDVDRVAQVATNLIVNALTYGAGDQPVSVALRDAGEDVELAVQNFGKPIPARVQAPLFDPMYRGAQGEKENGGLGLGLFIAKQIVAAHHGTIAVKSSDLEGTTFTVRLPRRFRRDSVRPKVDLSRARAHHD